MTNVVTIRVPRALQENYGAQWLRVPKGSGGAYTTALRNHRYLEAGDVANALLLAGYRVNKCVVLNEWPPLKRLASYVWAILEYEKGAKNPHPRPDWFTSEPFSAHLSGEGGGKTATTVFGEHSLELVDGELRGSLPCPNCSKVHW